MIFILISTNQILATVPNPISSARIPPLGKILGAGISLVNLNKVMKINNCKYK